jgi:arylsulfatase A-like enzyme
MLSTHVLLAASVAAAVAADQARPNLVLLLSDDGGFADFPRYGAELEIRMPQCERLMDGGVRFTDAYVSAPICTPSRAGLHTGRHNQRFGIYTNGDVYQAETRRRFTEATTIAERLGQAGYATGLIGKWHLPFEKSMTVEHGFLEYVGLKQAKGMDQFMAGTELYDAAGRKTGTSPAYLTDHWGTLACDYIERHRSAPFFLSVCFNAVHTPMEALDADMLHAEQVLRQDPNRRIYTGMAAALDRNLGRILDRLDALGLSENTLVAFVNDNGSIGTFGVGGAGSNNYGQNTPLRDGKFSLHEGGIRTPFVLRWAGRLPPGAVRTGLVSTLDLGATFAAAAGVPVPAGDLDGHDLLPYAAGTVADTPRPHHVWQAPIGMDGKDGRCQVAVRRGPWKIYLGSTPDKPGPDAPWELYHLADDIGETQNLAAQHPDLVRELACIYTQWRTGMVDRPTPRKAR